MVRARLNFIGIFFGRVSSFSGSRNCAATKLLCLFFACIISQGAFATLCYFSEPDGLPSRVRVIILLLPILGRLNSSAFVHLETPRVVKLARSDRPVRLKRAIFNAWRDSGTFHQKLGL